MTRKTVILSLTVLGLVGLGSLLVSTGAMQAGGGGACCPMMGADSTAAPTGSGGEGKSCPMAGARATGAPTASDKAVACPKGKGCPACKDGKACDACAAKGLCAARCAQVKAGLETALKDLTEAEAAVKAGQKDKALAELAEVRKCLTALQKNSPAPAAPAATPAPTAGVVNGKCPIMGGKIDPSTVKADLTREFKGKKVGFCCGGCPAAWDKLSDDEKQAKLDKAASGS